MTQVTEQQEAPRERLAESAQAAHAAVAGLDRGYARRLAEALHENGDPVSVDAAEEFERLLAGAPTAQAAPQPAPIFGDEDHVLVPRGLLGAACSAIDKKRDGVKTLAELRRYTTGDLSKAAPQQDDRKPYAYAVYFPDQPTVALVHDLDELTDDLTNREHQITKLYAAPQEAPTAAAGPSEFPHEQMDVMALARYKVMPSHESMFHRHAVVAGDGSQQLYIGREVECENMARKFAGAFLDGAFAFHSMLSAAPTTQAAPAAQGDALARAEALHEAVAAIYFDDGSKFKSALDAVVRHLDQKLAADLLGFPKRAFDTSLAQLYAARSQAKEGGA